MQKYQYPIWKRPSNDELTQGIGGWGQAVGPSISLFLEIENLGWIVRSQ